MTLDKKTTAELKNFDAQEFRENLDEEAKTFIKQMDKKVQEQDKKELQKKRRLEKAELELKDVFPEPGDEVILFNILRAKNFTIKDKKAAVAILAYYAKRITRRHFLGNRITELGFGSLSAISLFIIFNRTFSNIHVTLYFFSIIIFHLGLYIRGK